MERICSRTEKAGVVVFDGLTKMAETMKESVSSLKKNIMDLDKPLNEKDKIEKADSLEQKKEILQNLDKPLSKENQEYFDDKGILYRVGDDLLPNTKYTINGYLYKTDGKGRILSAEGKLRVKEHEGRLTIKDTLEDIGKGFEKETDDRGHLIGDQFGGSNGLENMIPQDANINRITFKNFENQLAKEVKANKDVQVKIDLIYKGDSRRPEALVVTYSIDGKKSMEIFKNGKG